jgi:light-dependent protochlorophyllide reductase
MTSESTDDTLFRTKGGAGKVAITSAEPWKYLTGQSRVSGYGSGSTAAEVAADWDGADKVAIVTGASAGLGVESAKALAARGCKVIMAVRDTAKGQKVLESIKAGLPSASLQVMHLDLDDLASVKAFAEAFKSSGQQLNILMCNAGVMAPPFTLSKDGYELQWATNHLGHFLLANLLLGVMETTARATGTEGRIVVVSSFGHSMLPLEVPKLAAALRPEALQSPDNYDPIAAYGRSKLCNVLFTRQLNAVMQAKGLPIVAAVCHPGYILATDLSKHMREGLMPRWLLNLLVATVGAAVFKIMGKTVAQGAATQVYLATAPPGAVLGGEYYSDANLAVSSVASHSKQLAQQLWDDSEQLCKAFM